MEGLCLLAFLTPEGWQSRSNAAVLKLILDSAGSCKERHSFWKVGIDLHGAVPTGTGAGIKVGI